MGLHRPFLEHEEAVERRRDQRANAGQRQALLHPQVELRLVGDREVRPAGGHHLRRVRQVRRGDHLDLEPLVGEVALLFGDDDRPVV